MRTKPFLKTLGIPTPSWQSRMRLTLLTALYGWAGCSAALAETGYDAWLRYAEIRDASALAQYEQLPAAVVTLGDSPLQQSASKELQRGVRGMLGRILREEGRIPEEPAIILGTLEEIRSRVSRDLQLPSLAAEGFWLTRLEIDGVQHLLVAGADDRGVLYGAFALLRKLALGEDLTKLDDTSEPAAPIRILNHWDNLDGTIERGYAGKSIFWEDGHVRADLSRVSDYARLMASLGINGCSINNVNADVRVISAEYLPEVARIAEAMRPWGVRTFISLDFASPRKMGGVETFDPLDPRSVEFWKKAIDTVYATVPDLGGFVLKADSEGRLGPSEYGRTHADAANAIARALKPHGGVLFYRGFVYNHKMDWRDVKNDRAKAAYDNFHKLDGQFEDNVVIQIKHGPIDFQVREPPSPLFGALEKTNQAIELQITQEYLGQQKHLCYVAPMWKEVLDFDMHADGSGTPVKDLVAGRVFKRPAGGFVGVSNVGRDENWLGHHLAMANLYAFGRLAWEPNLSSETIAEEWTRQTFGSQPNVAETIVDMLMRSWPIYESYTGPLGIGTLTDIIHIHFGPAPESSEYNGWGQWHRANDKGVGMNRTVATGTGFTAQYREPVAERLESLETCPDELLLFFHHVPYTHVLHNGKTVIQHFYDEHYDGAEQAAGLAEAWRNLAGLVDEQRYNEVLQRLEYQAGHAQVWRDSICNWFHRKSGIDDEQGRVGSHPHRFEAEELELAGYRTTAIDPWEAASGSEAVEIPAGRESGEVRLAYNGEPGWFEVRLQYFDEEDGVSKFETYLNDQPLDRWIADQHLPTPTTKPDAHSSIRRTIRGVPLRPGDVVRIIGKADQDERAGVDYLELIPEARPAGRVAQQAEP
jgi:alpha-glucuronidase